MRSTLYLGGRVEPCVADPFVVGDAAGLGATGAGLVLAGPAFASGSWDAACFPAASICAAVGISMEVASGWAAGETCAPLDQAPWFSFGVVWDAGEVAGEAAGELCATLNACQLRT